jgi:hypothetical protein
MEYKYLLEWTNCYICHKQHIKSTDHSRKFKTTRFNLFLSNFPATRILLSSYLFWVQKKLVDYL